MINPKSVRIGNTVLFDGREFKLHAIAPDAPFLDTMEFGVGVVTWDNISGVPITPEWLDSVGFHLSGNMWFMKDCIGWDNGQVYFGSAEKLVSAQYTYQIENLYFELTGSEIKK